MNTIVTVNRQVYYPHSKKRGAALIGACYVGNGLRREEYLCFEGVSDWTTHRSRRISEDNGRTWSDWQLLYRSWPTQKGFTKREEARAGCYDPVSGKSIDFIFQRILPCVGSNPMEEYFGRADHNFWRCASAAEMIRKACEESLPAEVAIGRILGTVDAFKGDAPQGDDMTCAVVRVEDVEA